jgi:DNA repair exonuclease SbcCD nuclease subunit
VRDARREPLDAPNREAAHRMLRLLHTADVHLGARHADLGDAAAAQRERQFAAFRASVDLALAEKVDLFLVAGDLFDSNTQPRRSVERVAAECARLAQARIRTVLIPGTHDLYDRSSVYRAYDLAALAGTGPADELVTVLTPQRPWIHLAALDAVVHGPVFATKRAPYSPLRDLASVQAPPATWKIGLLHAAIAIPGRTDHDEVVITTDEIAASGLDYLALGHWHSAQKAKARDVTYAYSGAPEPVAVDQDRAGKVLLVTLDQRDGRRSVTVEERTVGRTVFERLDLDAAAIGSQPALVTRLRASASPDLVLDVRLIGVRPDSLDLATNEVEDALRGAFLRVRVRDVSQAALSQGVLPPPETIAGAFIRNVEGRIAELESAAGGQSVAKAPAVAGNAAPAIAGGQSAARDAVAAEANELRDVLRLGRLLLAGHEVTL